MTAADVEGFVELADELKVTVWLDGGWAVDACLGEQTRRHSDLDIVVTKRDAAVLEIALRQQGFTDVPRDDTRPWNFVLGDEEGREIDFHVIELDHNGDGVYGPPENDDRYRAEALSGRGVINGRAVRCMTPEWLVASHTGYELQDKDHADVAALCDRFGIPLPDEHRGSANTR